MGRQRVLLPTAARDGSGRKVLAALWLSCALTFALAGTLWAGGDRVGVESGARAVSEADSDLVQIAEVRVQVSDRGPVVLLLAERRAIPIFVDMTVAGSIQGALSGVELPRPMTHDLMHTILTETGGRVTRVVVTLKDRTFYGALSIAWEGRERTFDSRASDAVALAVHFHAPVFVPRALLETVGQQEDGAAKKDL